MTSRLASRTGQRGQHRGPCRIEDAPGKGAVGAVSLQGEVDQQGGFDWGGEHDGSYQVKS